MYPPLMTVFYAILGHFIIPYVSVAPGQLDDFAIRDSQLGIMSFVILTLLTFYALYLVFSRIMKPWISERN